MYVIDYNVIYTITGCMRKLQSAQRNWCGAKLLFVLIDVRSTGPVFTVGLVITWLARSSVGQ